MRGYIGRFAPSPTGPLHAGSLVAALASWLDARAQDGQWLVRIEDVDRSRCLPGLDQFILQQLAACGLHSDQPPVYQSQRGSLYQQALDSLAQRGLAYPCACTRKEIAATQAELGHGRSRHSELIYPGTCRFGLHERPARAWRLRTDVYMKNRPPALMGQAQTAIYSIVNKTADSPPNLALSASANTPLSWTDRRLGRQQQDVQAAVGDFILKRADGCFAYQLAVVVDDAEQGISDIVRGEDLADNTARQILLQQALGLPTPHYLHTPLVLGDNGEKLSKQNGAQALDTHNPLAELNRAAALLGLPAQQDAATGLAHWVAQWRAVASVSQG
ncbi:MAG: tRNA glutamyl-Q(34) synthetase GluQRS [Rhodoferax sp.]